MMTELTPLQALIHKHCDTLQREMSDVIAAFDAWENDSGNAQILTQTAISAVHKIKGSSGTIGFSDISERAQGVETKLKMYDPKISLVLADEILVDYCALRALIEEISPQKSTLYDVQIPS